MARARRCACSAVSTIGTRTVWQPMSSTCLTIQFSSVGRRMTGAAPPAPIACSWASMERRSLGACSPSITSQSKPAPASSSAL